LIPPDEGLPRADGVGRDGQAFEHQVRVRPEEPSILERAGFALGGVADDELRGAGIVPDGAPLDPGGEPRAPSSSKAGPADLFDDLLGRALHSFRQALPATGAEVVVEGGDRLFRQ